MLMRNQAIIKMPEKLRLKKNAILRIIRRNGPMGRLEVARSLHMSNSRVCEFIQIMIDDGLLLEDHKGSDRRGRRGVPVRVNPDYGTILGFDMEALRLRMVSCDFAGQLIDQYQKKLKPAGSRQELLDQLLAFITSGFRKLGQHRDIIGLGLATAGLTDPRRGVILHYDMLEAARDLPLRDLVQSQIKVPCWMGGNINSLTVAEWMSGAARGLQNFICFAVRSGIGAGIFLNGKLYVGHHGLAGEAGYSVVPNSSQPAQWKYLQKIVSESALGVDSESGKLELSSNQIQRMGDLLGAQLASMVAMLDVEAVILAGGLIRPDGPLHEPMVRAFQRFAVPELASTQLRVAELGPFGAAIGAAHCCFQDRYPMAPPTDRARM